MAEMAATMPRPKGEARWLSSLRVRLALAIAVSVGITGVGASWLALQLARQALAEEVRANTARATERAVDELELLPGPLTGHLVGQTLRQLQASIAGIDTLAYVEQAPSGPVVIFMTGMASQTATTDLARRAIDERRVVVAEADGSVRIAAPVVRKGEPAAAVMARADLAGVIRLQQRALRAVVGFALLSAIALVVLVDLLAWPLVHRPIEQLRDTIARVTAGDFAARAPVARKDELGEVGEGLNEMLARLENFNDSLQTRVREATLELQQRNHQLVESYHRLFGLREQLASAEQLASVGQTAANVAHQVGTPLNLISGYVQLLREELGPDSAHEARLAIIEEQIAKVTTTVRTLLDRSRQMGRKTRTAAGDLVTRVCEVMRPNLEAAGIRLQMETPGGDTPILVDATNLELALLNLMTNAVDSMPNGGTLGVSVAANAPYRVTIAIRDTGHGIPEDLLPRIFEPWVSTKKPGRGTGLGLAIARDVVSAHGGTIAVVSSVGQGTTFTIDLPSDSGRDVGRMSS
jgi:two-component system, NtrC family, sensor kinase